MGEPTLSRRDEMIIINFGDDECATGTDWVATMNDLLDEAAAIEGPKVLVTTSSGKHYSNGLDVAWMAGKTAEEITGYVHTVQAVLARILTFPAPTVAAVNGHAFGAGAFLILAHDHAVMRDDRGYVCWPEVHLQMSFTAGLMAMVKNLMTAQTARQAVVTGRRFSGPDAVEAGFVDVVVSLDQLLDAASKLGGPHAASAGDNLSLIKSQLHGPTLAALTGTD